MSTADKAIRWSTVAAVVVVATVAASFSYQHALDVVCRYSRPSRLNVIYPVAIDGLIYAASMTLLNDARRQLRPHRLAYWALGLGIAATLTVNLVSGLQYGIPGAAIGAWPAVALVLSYELLMIIMRRSARPAAPEPAASEVPVPEPPAELNGHGHQAAELFAAELAEGKVPGIRRIRKGLKVGQPRATAIREYLKEVTPAAP